MTLVRPSSSAIPDVSAVRILSTRAVPLIVGAPVAGTFGLAATVAVGALVKVSPFPRSSVKLTRTLGGLHSMTVMPVHPSSIVLTTPTASMGIPSSGSSSGSASNTTLASNASMPTVSRTVDASS